MQKDLIEHVHHQTALWWQEKELHSSLGTSLAVNSQHIHNVNKMLMQISVDKWIHLYTEVNDKPM